MDRERRHKFRGQAFLEKAETISGKADHLVCYASYLESPDKMQEHLSSVKQDLLDFILFRFNRCIIELDSEVGETHFLSRPGIFDLFRQFLIEDLQLRRGNCGPNIEIAVPPEGIITRRRTYCRVEYVW